MLDRVLDRTLAVRIPNACRVSDDTIVLEHRGVKMIDLRLVQVRRNTPFLEVTEDDVLNTATEIAERFFVQSRPHLLPGFPDNPPETVARIAQRHYE
jgi:hypothetical protein